MSPARRKTRRKTRRPPTRRASRAACSACLPVKDALQAQGHLRRLSLCFHACLFAEVTLRQWLKAAIHVLFVVAAVTLAVAIAPAAAVTRAVARAVARALATGFFAAAAGRVTAARRTAGILTLRTAVIHAAAARLLGSGRHSRRQLSCSTRMEPSPRHVLVVMWAVPAFLTTTANRETAWRLREVVHICE